MKRYDVYAIGNALVDFLTFVDDQFLIDKGIRKGLMTLVDQPAEKTLEGIDHRDIVRCSGGSAANTIVGIALLGGKGCFTGKVGNDDLGKFYGANLQDAGVEFFVNPDSKPTGSCVSLVSPDAERSMLTYLGASTQLSDIDVHQDALRESQYLYVEGYLWDSPPARAAAVHAMEWAKRHDVRIAFSFSDPWLVERFRDDFTRLLDTYIDVLFLNEREAGEITGYEDPLMASKQLAKKVKQLCLTRGEEGAIIANNGRLRSTPRLTIPKVIDTTGAGDLYAAGVLRGLSLGFDLSTSSMIGARVAAAVVEKVGARLTAADLH